MTLQICHHFAKAIPSACAANEVRQLDTPRVSSEGSLHFGAERLRDFYVYPVPFLHPRWLVGVRASQMRGENAL